MTGALAIVLGFSLATSAVQAASAPPPTVILITLDTTRADRLGCYGRANADTPNLDRLAASGARFAEAWAVAPITLPSHLTMLTGCTPVTHGVRDNGQARYDGHIPTLATRFAAAGYRTAAVVSAPVLDAAWGANAGFTTYDDRLDGARERPAAATTSRALEIVAASSDPLFVWVHYFEPHWPYAPPPPFAARHKGDPYQGEIAAMDAEIGRLLAGLAKAGRKPLVVVAGDHGEGLGEHRERTHGIFTYRSTLRVPFLVAGPGLTPRVIPNLVSLMDLAPTVAELAGLPPAATQDGVSVAALLRGGAPPPARDLYFESMLPQNSYGWAAPRGFTDGRYVYIDLPKREVYDLRTDPQQAKNLFTVDDKTSAALAVRFESIARHLDDGAGHEAAAALSEDERAKLAALGYVAGATPAAAPTLDPKDVIELADRVDQAKEQYLAGRYGEAIATADEILRRNPDNVPALTVRGQALLASKRFTDAVAAFTAAVARNPSLATNHFDLGASYLGAGDIAKADAQWRRAIAIDPHFPEPRASLIAAHRERGEMGTALEDAGAAAAAGIDSAELDFQIGLTFATAGRLDDAQHWFEAAVKIRPAYVEALANLGQIAYQRGRVDEALARYRAAAEAAPGESRFQKSIGAILWNDRNDTAGALAAFRKALAVERDPEERAQLEASIQELLQALPK